MNQIYSTLREWYSVLAALIVFGIGVTVLPGLTFANGGFSFAGPIQLKGNSVGYSTQSGLQIAINSSWVGSRGYWPVKVQLSSPQPSTAERQITIRFSAGRRYNQSPPITVEQDFELSRGDTTAAIKLLVPQYLDWSYCRWQVWVDGVLDEQLSTDVHSFNRTGNNDTMSLFVPEGLGQSFLGTLNQDQISTGQIDFVPGSQKLPEKWLDYSSVDVVGTSSRELLSWKRDFPDRFLELMRWIRAGGNLWIAGENDLLDQILEVESTFASSSEQSGSTLGDDGLPLGWHFLVLRDNSAKGVDALLALRSEEQSVIGASARGNRDYPNLPSDSRDWFATRPFGMGTITVFLNESRRDPATAFEVVDGSLLADRVSWETRHGNDPGRRNFEFNNFLIPDVGTAPVFEFQILMSLFVVAIGPVNYWLLRRRGQLPLLLLTVPVGAFTTTLLLFAYGFFSQGAGHQCTSAEFYDTRSSFGRGGFVGLGSRTT